LNYACLRKKQELQTRRSLIGKIRKEKEMPYAQPEEQQVRTDEDIMVWLMAKSTEELRRFMRGPWTASILTSEQIEELYDELKRREGSLEYFVELGLD
jgi:hypothetical protein